MKELPKYWLNVAEAYRGKPVEQVHRDPAPGGMAAAVARAADWLAKRELAYRQTRVILPGRC